MRIAVWHNLPSGGGKRALYYHVKGLVERGHYVESWCSPSADQNYLPLNSLVKENILPFPEKITQRPHRLKRWLAPYDQIVERLEALDAHCQQCAAEINKAEFDVLFANSSIPFYNSPIGRYAKTPCLIYLQEPYRWLYEAIPQLPWVAIDNPNHPKITVGYLKTLIRDWIKVQGLRVQMREELKNARAYKKILVNSLFSRESVLRAYDLESYVCYLGIDTDLFMPTNHSKEGYVVGLGSFTVNKRIERAIQSISTIRPSERPKLIWFGNTQDLSYLKKLKDMAQDLEVDFEPKVKVSDAELTDALSRAAAMIYTPYLEPFGFAPLEANACGTAVVAIAEGGIRETIQNGVNGFLIPGYDPFQLGQAVAKLVMDRNLAKTMGQQARRLVVEQWSLHGSIDRLEKELFNL